MDAIVAAYGSNASSSSDDEHSHRDSESEDEAPRKRQRLDVDASSVRWTRAFPHVEGNWPSHVKINVPLTPELQTHCQRVITATQRFVGDEVELIPMASEEEELHMSLSRPFVLTYEQIEPFVEALRAALKWRRRFALTVEEPTVLVNDERTRSFLALQLDAGKQEFVKTVRCVDQCMQDFQLPTYYEDPIPHVSIASALGDTLADKLPQAQLSNLLVSPKAHADSEETEEQTGSVNCMIRVSSVHVVIGNKHFEIPLL
ncbi:hypothetical protein Poli38472_006290 [Pythium oligandrum]|uniref:U6 snRNA phosphodiesterase n=1 Tax=Pythium oligandrum TaxID=41045 RepID=A0A8K1FRB5_PYTOL|nr:hypothetical protein Poli38472_006290 [Pythium oligandrum]|eukprot:TMW68822.1 hypothetical protein Poli38472_006290 [Pythium oligandrum]